MSNIDAMAADLFATISVYIDKRIAAAVEKIATETQAKLDAAKEAMELGRDGLLEEICTTDENVANLGKAVAELKALPPPKDGDPGEPGTPGKDFDPELIVLEAAKGMTRMEESLKNVLAERMDARIEREAATLAKMIADMPPPKSGDPGPPGDKGKDAEPVDYDAVVKKCLALIPPPKDGEDGIDGRDSIQCDVLDFIDPERRYQRGTFATHKGGLIRAFRATDPLGDATLEKAGWAVVVNGVFEEREETKDDGRERVRTTIYTNGKEWVRSEKSAVILDRGKFIPDSAYAKGDAATWDGSLWIAQMDIEKSGDKPLPPEWRLSVKRGQDGKDLRTDGPVRPREPLRLR